ncbi:uncharacterized protein LOC114974584 [Acropora millepora]|uniref:uncharacterized protein LOC114974584 n=1 Tax=Acropora millepora TaxID=45264 RepID=UPI001CF51CC1|nr:uncharacterized protein LOC114974584 [Acropora millepora]
MTVHVFGATSSPSCASFCLLRTAEDNKDAFPSEIVNTVRRNFYVDDCLKSVRTRHDARLLVRMLTELLSRGGFSLRKWMSNDREVLASIPSNERAKSVVNLDLDKMPTEHALGVQWNVETDEFIFKVIAKENHQPADELCRKKIGWDEEVEGQDLSDWKHWLTALPKLSDVTVRRCYKPDSFGQVSHTQIHHFSDASQCAYGAASYLRIVDTDGNIHCSFVVGKSRLAPLKGITIPRLELSAAVVSVKLDNMIRRELDLPIKESIFWSDFTSVIQLIQNQTKRFQTFVANRLSIIHDGSSLEQWRYVDSRSNPADDASRGLTAEQLIRNKRWLHGPEFLWKSDEYWPSLVTVPNLPDNHPRGKARSSDVCDFTQGRHELILRTLFFLGSTQEGSCVAVEVQAFST